MNQGSVIERVLEAERLRAAAVVARDTAALRAVAHDELVYVHATGARHDKAEWLSHVERGPRFTQVDFEVQQALALGTAVLLHGELRLQLRRHGEAVAVSAQSWASALWWCDASGQWQLRLFQSTRPAA